MLETYQIQNPKTSQGWLAEKGIFPQSMKLGQVGIVPNDQLVVFVTDETNQIVGLVSADAIRSRLTAGDQEERCRWAESPLSSLVLIRFSQAERSDALFDLGEGFLENNVQALRDQGRLVGISTPDDFLLSWQAIHPLLEKAARDPLTQLLNWAHFECRLHEEWDRAARHKQSIGLILCNIDQFRHLNETYGSLLGDQVIQSISRTLENCLRAYDLVSRFGGDEFACLSVGCQPGTIAVPMQRIQTAIADLNAYWENEHVRVSLSLGAAVCHSNLEEFEPDDLLQAANQCLTRAKADGSGQGYFEEISPEHFWTGQRKRVPIKLSGPSSFSGLPACADLINEECHD